MKKQLLTILFLFAAISSFAQTPSYVPTNGLIGWWPFNGNANDESGNGNHCTTFNTPVLDFDRHGVANKSYLLDGVNDWIETNSTIFQTSNNHTISMWWKTTDSAKTNQILFNTNPHPLETVAYHYSSVSSSPPYDLFYGMGDGNQWNIKHPDAGQISTPPTNNMWHHFVWVKDSFLIWNFYCDAVLVHTFNGIANTGSQNANLRFGAENNGFPTGGGNFKGNIDDIGVWNRALDSAEIAALYNGCSSIITNQPSNQSVNLNSNVQFNVTCSSATATYQWQQNSGTGYVNLSNFGQFLGVTNDTLTISNVTLLQNNYGYRCLINDNGCLDTSTAAILTVINNTSITTNEYQNTVSIFPNPANEQITIETAINYHSVNIVNVLGQVLISQSKTKTINIQNLENGVYFVQLLDEKGDLLKKEKFIK